MERIFVDTSAWLAHANRREPEHARIVESLRAYRGRLVTSNFVFAETVTICLRRLGRPAAIRVGEALLDPCLVSLQRVTVADEQEAWELLLSRADRELSFTDCTSFVLMRRLGLTSVATLDDDFRSEGFAIV